MTIISERVYIEAPWVQASGALERRLGLHPGESAGHCTLTLVAPLGEGREIARDVRADIVMLPSANSFTTRYRITWPSGRTARGVPTPGFDGTIALRAGEDYSESELVLEGSYAPPGGAAGRLFDDIVGRRIAHATLGALLEGVRAELREAHERTEAQKHAV